MSNTQQLSNMMSDFQDLNNTFSQSLTSLENDLKNLQYQLQTLKQNVQQIREEEINLKNTLAGSLANFEEKSGQRSLFGGNAQLKHDIMQKRVSIDQSCVNLMDSTNQVSQTVDNTLSSVSQIMENMNKDFKFLEHEYSRLENQMSSQTSQSQLQPLTANAEFSQELATPIDLIQSTMDTLSQLQNNNGS